jgi:hypothetical protein
MTVVAKAQGREIHRADHRLTDDEVQSVVSMLNARAVLMAWERGYRWDAHIIAEAAGEGSHADWLYWFLVVREIG